ncbi:YrzI family small protein [Tuberibacillus sp. Marseille-P3662]|nr:YrzI family small protein [Tuberibacillus sp. Marseille-P3662]
MFKVNIFTFTLIIRVKRRERSAEMVEEAQRQRTVCDEMLDRRATFINKM